MQNNEDDLNKAESTPKEESYGGFQYKHNYDEYKKELMEKQKRTRGSAVLTVLLIIGLVVLFLCLGAYIADTILQLIYNSSKYLYITTPYLVLDDDIMEALAIASKRGTDVRLITPGIPDKKIVNMITKHSYGYLLKNGVKIYEYTPGFIHAKTIVTDECSLIGTINMDFRSLFIHYECGALMWDEKLREIIAADFMDTVCESHEVTYEEWKNRPAFTKLLQNFFALFSSLM